MLVVNFNVMLSCGQVELINMKKYLLNSKNNKKIRNFIFYLSTPTKLIVACILWLIPIISFIIAKYFNFSDKSLFYNVLFILLSIACFFSGAAINNKKMKCRLITLSNILFVTGLFMLGLMLMNLLFL